MLLEVKDMSTGYGKKEMLRNVTLKVANGEIVAISGHNGAGKTTLLSAIIGILPVRSGTIAFNGKNITNASPNYNVKQGLCLVPQGIGVFRDLSVIENLRLVSHLQRGKENKQLISEALEFFPLLKHLVTQLAGTLSGGERQMLAVAMSLVARPKLIMLDEPSLGLSPIATEEVLYQIKQMNQKIGCAVLMVEENIHKALSISDRVYIFKTGRVILEESVDKFLERDQYWELY